MPTSHTLGLGLKLGEGMTPHRARTLVLPDLVRTAEAAARLYTRVDVDWMPWADIKSEEVTSSG